MKLSSKTLAILLFAGIMYACNSGDKTSTTTTSDSAVGSDKPSSMDTSHANATAMDTSSTATHTSTASAEQDFLNYAIPANTKEIMWLKAGMEKGNKEIKHDAAMMLKDHKKLEASVKGLMAAKPSFTMPAVDTSDVASAMTAFGQTGAAWDKAWADKMVDEHTALLDQLNKAKSNVKDADLSKLVNSTIPVVESHLAMAKKTTGQNEKIKMLLNCKEAGQMGPVSLQCIVVVLVECCENCSRDEISPV